MDVAMGALELGPRIHGVWSLQCVVHEARGKENSEAQPETAAAACSRRSEYSIAFPPSPLVPCLAS